MQNAIQNSYTKTISVIRVISGCCKMFNQIHLFMQNKPNFRKPKMNITSLITKAYENQTLGMRGKNKPNQTQFFKQSYQLMLLHSKYLKKTRGEFREKNLNQPQSQKRAPFTQSFQLLVGKIPRLVSFGIFVIPFQTTFITTYISTTYKKTPKKTLVFRSKTHVVKSFTNV